MPVGEEHIFHGAVGIWGDVQVIAEHVAQLVWCGKLLTVVDVLSQSSLVVQNDRVLRLERQNCEMPQRRTCSKTIPPSVWQSSFAFDGKRSSTAQVYTAMLACPSVQPTVLTQQ